MFRYSIVFLASIFVCCAVLGQNPEEDPEHAVKAALDPKHVGMYDSFLERRLSRMGDGAAVTVIKLLGSRDPSHSEVGQILYIVRTAFVAPAVVHSEADRKPRATLFLLRRLSLWATPEQRERILELEGYVEEQYRKAVRNKDNNT